MKTYQVELPNIVVVPEVLPEVEVVHEFKDESEWVLSSGINPDEWYHVLARETRVYQRFMVKSLLIGCR